MPQIVSHRVHTALEVIIIEVQYGDFRSEWLLILLGRQFDKDNMGPVGSQPPRPGELD